MRPRVPDERRLSEVLTVRVTPDHRRRLQALADKESMTIQELLREALDEKLMPRTAVIAPSDHVQGQLADLFERMAAIHRAFTVTAGQLMLRRSVDGKRRRWKGLMQEAVNRVAPMIDDACRHVSRLILTIGEHHGWSVRGRRFVRRHPEAARRAFSFR